MCSDTHERLRELVGALADGDRLVVFAALVLGSAGAEEIAARTGRPRRDVTAALSRLVSVGLAVRSGQLFEAAPGALAEAARAARAADEEQDGEPVDGAATHVQAQVLGRYMRAGKVTAIPARPAARTALLDFLAGQFTPGAKYPEREVNAVLARYHPDTAALRRLLVDEGFLDRDHGIYWRSGGTFDVG